MAAYQICSNCIMDTSDPLIFFDEQGVCNHCRNFEQVTRYNWFPNEEGARRLTEILTRIKNKEKDKEYDCILGLSGGVDSSFVAYKAKEFGLRPLVVHVDGGWNSELAVKNIETICKKLEYDLFTHVVDWEEIKDLQLAFLRSGVANQDTPQDHAFFAALYRFAEQHKIKYVLTGTNYATEGILPAAWGYDAMDAKHLLSIHNQFGKRPLRSFPTVNFYKYRIYYPYLLGMKIVRPLDYMLYSKDEAVRILENELGWRYYGAKHWESRFTKFFQGYYLPTKFGYDKRRAHYSSLVVSGQMTRGNALVEMETVVYPPEQIVEDRTFLTKKLDLSEQEFEELMCLPNRSFTDFPSDNGLRMALHRVAKGVRAVKRLLVK